MVAVADADLILFLTTDTRTALTALADSRFPISKGWIADREWDPARNNGTAPAWQVIFRDDGVDDVELHVGEQSVGISVLAGSKDNPAPARALARIVKTIVKQTPRVQAGNPVAAVTSFLGPYAVDEASTFARQYMAASFTVVGVPL